MKKQIEFVIIFTTLLLSSFICINTNATETSGKTIYVGGTGNGNYSTIREAIDTTNDGDKIYVYSGIYLEHSLIIDKEILLVGEDCNTTIIVGYKFNDTITVYRDNVGMSGFSFLNGSMGINIYDSNFCNVNNCIYRNCLFGIHLYSSDDNEISSNVFIDSINGLELEESFRNKVNKNNFIDNQRGLFCAYSPTNIVEFNNFISNDEDAKFTKFFHMGFLKPNVWKENYWDTWNGFFVKIIPGVMYIPNRHLIGFFSPWIEIDYNPARVPY